jgi:hypothetical protein
VRETCDRLVGVLLGRATALPALAEEPGAALRAPVVAALGKIFSIATGPGGKLAEDALALVGRVLSADEDEEAPARDPGSHRNEPAIPALDPFELLAVSPTREDNDAMAGLVDLLRPDFSFMAGALTPLPGLGPRRPKTPLDTRIDRAIGELRKRIGKQLDQFDKLITRYLDKSTMPRTGRVAVALGAEHQTLHRRLAIATVFGAGGVAIDLANRFAQVGRADGVLAEEWERVKRFFRGDIGSDKDLGNDVQRRLQKGYRQQHLRKIRKPVGPPFQLLQEKRLYADGLREQSVTLAAGAQIGADGSLRALHYARQPSRALAFALSDAFENEFREDCLDLRRTELWEIKPIRSSALGVIQEFHYRGSFNLVNAMLQDLAALPADSSLRTIAQKMGILHEGPFSCPQGAHAGTSNTWDKGGIKRPWVDRSRKDRRGQVMPRAVFVVTVPDQLPGLVIYVIFIVRGEIGAALLAAIAAVIERLLRRYAQDLEKLVRDIERGVTVVVGLVLAAAIVYFLLLLALEAIAALSGAAAALAALLTEALAALRIAVPVPTQGEAETLVRTLATAAFGPLKDGTLPHAALLSDRLLIEYPETTLDGDIGASDVLISGLIELKRMPASRFAAVSALLGICVTIAFGALAAGVSEHPFPGEPIA